MIGLLYSYYTPLWLPPDEELHFAYCEYIAKNHSLPQSILSTKQARISQAFHPPLYYLIGSIFCSKKQKPIHELLTVNDGPGFSIIQHPEGETSIAQRAYLLRIFSLLFSLITVFCVYNLMLSLVPGETMLATATSLFVATNPQFLHISASISNETLAATFSTIYIVVLLKYCSQRDRLFHSVTLGVILSGCLLTKTSTVFLIPLTLCVILFYRFRYWKRLVLECIVLFGIVFIIAGWWYQENWMLFTNMQTAQPWFIRTTALSIENISNNFIYTFMSFFGYFGSLQIPLKPIHYSFYVTLLLMGIIGLCKLTMKRHVNKFQQEALVILFFAFMGGLSIFMSLNMKYFAFLGRYLFVVLAPIAALIFFGLWNIIPKNYRNLCLLCISISMIVLSFDIIFNILMPAYAKPRLEEGVTQQAFCCLSPIIKNSQAVSQTFTASQNNLCAIRIMFSNLGKQTKHNVQFTIKEMQPVEKVLHQITCSLCDVNIASRYYITFPPIINSKNKQYQLRITLTDPVSQNISAWYERENVYPEGTMMKNGTELLGDLYFSTYYFTGDIPYSPWEGSRALVIPMGLYIPVKELQFYYECAPEIRLKSVTHNKIARFEKAFKTIEPFLLKRTF
jgi:hypothetical protein